MGREQAGIVLTEGMVMSSVIDGGGVDLIGMKKRLYIDVCTLCRPYDDQALLPIRLETDAYYLIMSHIDQGRYVAVASPVHFAEVDDIDDVYQRVEVEKLLERFLANGKHSAVAVRERAETLVRSKFGVADAAHVAFAEVMADVFISSDKDLVKRCRACRVKIAVYSPLEFVAAEELR